MGEFDFLNGGSQTKESQDEGQSQAESKDQSANRSTKTENQSSEVTAKNIISKTVQMTAFKKELDKYLVKERQENKHDPRPDVNEDHYIWQELLKTAEKINPEAYELLHGLRCAGCQLKLVYNPKKRRKSLKLDLDESKELLEMFIDQEELKKVGNKSPDQIAMFGENKKEIFRKRKEASERAKKKMQLREEAVKYIKETWLKPKIKPLAEVFNEIQPLINKVSKKETDLNILKFNNYLADIEYRKKRGASQ